MSACGLDECDVYGCAYMNCPYRCDVDPEDPIEDELEHEEYYSD